MLWKGPYSGAYQVARTEVGGVPRSGETLGHTSRGQIRRTAHTHLTSWNSDSGNVEQVRVRFQPLDGRKKDIKRKVPRLEAEIDVWR